VLEDFAFVTPADSGADVYAVSLKYRVNGYRPDGQFTESWTFTGYGAAAVGNMLGLGSEALQTAVGLAMRDAGARLATELHEQAIVRGLLPAGTPAPAVEAQPPK
jgi:2-methylcitrate dehydratase PrpD